MAGLVHASGTAGIRVLPFVVVLFLLCPSSADAAQWVGSPTVSSTGGGDIEAGGRCGGFADIDGNRLLFFDGYHGTWTDLSLPATHNVLAVEAAGDVVLIVMDDLLVAFDAPDQAVHQQPLLGSLLSTSTIPSWSCSAELAAAITDQALYVYDARRNTWAVHAYSMPDYQSHQSTTADADYVAVELYRGSFSPVNFAYSLHTGTFDVADPGAGSLAQGHLLDHGFAGQFGPGDGVRGMGYSALTGAFNELVPEASDTGLGGEQVYRKRRELCHLWSLSGFHGDLQTQWFYTYIYDTLTDSWTRLIYSYDKSTTGGPAQSFSGGAYTYFYSQDLATHGFGIDVFSGIDHGVIRVIPGLYGANLARVIGGDVAGFSSGYQFTGWQSWFLRSLDQPQGRLLVPDRPLPGAAIAGQEYVSFTARDIGDPRMNIYFYHGPSNRLRSVEIWSSTEQPDHDGTHVHAMVTNGDDTDIVLYSGFHHDLFLRHMPANSWPTRKVGEDLVLVYRNGTGDYLLDGRRGTLESRGCDFAPNSLGEDVCLGIDPVAQELHAYSSLSGHWTTQSTDGLMYVRAGGTVGLGFRSDYRRFYGFAGDEDAWAELTTTGVAFRTDVGKHVILVMDTDRVWALWQDQATAVGGDDDLPTLTASQALSQMRCFPNPFNGRLNVDFELPQPALVQVEIFDPRGRKVATLVDGFRETGDVNVAWPTGDLASGVYLVRAVVDGHVGVRKVSLVQ